MPAFAGRAGDSRWKIGHRLSAIGRSLGGAAMLASSTVNEGESIHFQAHKRVFLQGHGPTRTSAKTTSFVIRCGRGRCKSGNRCRQLHADSLHRFSATELIAIHQASESVRYPTTPVDRVERRRWKIERLFAWLRNFRRLVVRYERYAENFLGILYLGCCVILLRHI